MTRAVLYRRVSREEQAEGGHSLESQQEDCLIRAAERGYRVVGDYWEVHSGDYLDERDSLWNVRQMMRRGEFDVLLFWKLDRLSRNTDHQSVLLYEASKYKVRVESICETIDDTPAGRLERQIRGIMADMERQNIRERSIRGKRHRAESGLPSGATAPYGYLWRDEARTGWIKSPATEQIVDEMWRMLHQGWGLRELARHLTATGVPTPHGGREWSSQAIKYIITNPCYWGEPQAMRTTHLKRQEVDGITGRSRTLDRVVVKPGLALPPETCPAYVPREVAETVLANICARRKGAGGASFGPENYLLRRGYLRCGYCGNTMTCRVKDGRYPAYVCTAGCFFSVHAYKVDNYCWEHVARTLANPQPLLDALEEYMREHATPASRRIEAWTAEIADLEAAVSNYLDNLGLVSGKSAQDIRDRLQSANERVEHLRIEVAKAQVSESSWQRVMQSVQTLLVTAREVGDLTYHQRRLSLYILGVKVTAWRKRHEPRWTVEMKPFDERCCVDKNTTIVFPLQPFYDLAAAAGLNLRLDGTVPKVSSSEVPKP